jgi:2-dehydro-3-deoxyphosphogluconate aldolase / (4S)-4-hydroxy-2-oxoglutarate aldolase
MSSDAARVVERLRAERVVGILRRVPAERAEAVVDALVAGGIRVVEVTLEGEGALPLIERLRARGGLLVAAGTVRSAADAERAVGAGAELLASPAARPDVIARARELGVPIAPGALTPTEIEAAWALGAAIVKLFPGSLGGPDYLRAVLAPLADVPVMVTGGVDARTAPGFIRAGAIAVGTGSSVVSPERVGRGDLEGIAAAARELVVAARDAG